MVKVSWRNLVAHKVRLLLSAFAIILGVAFVAGSFIFTDALGGSFSGIIRGTTSDVEIAPKGATDFESQQDTRTIPAGVVDEINALPEVDQANGNLTVQGVYIISADDELVGGNGPPGLAVNYTGTRSLEGKEILTLVDGRLPEKPGEVAFDEAAAEKAGYEFGDEVKLTSPGDPPSIERTFVGTVRFGSEGGLVGATLTVFDEQDMQDTFFGGRDVYTGISVNTAPGVSQQEAADAISAILPPDIVAKTGDAYADENEDSIAEALQFINVFLLVFAFVAVVVSTFLIINTFSILVAQRSRELALLRAMGASKRQVKGAVALEALVVGLIGSTAGLFIGYLLALGIRELFGRFGLDLSGAEFLIEPRTIIVSYLVGIFVTMFAAYLPARRAARIPPVAAMRDDVALPEATLRRRFLFGAAMAVLGVVSAFAGFAGSGSSGLSLIGLGALLILVGVSLMSPVLGGPIIHGLGKLYRRLFGTVGTLASENSLRNPRRTAATASALMIGLTLVALMSILGSSASASTEKAIKSALTSELVVSDAIGTPFSPAFAKEIEQVDGVAAVARFRQANAEIDGSSVWVGAADPAVLDLGLNVQLLGSQSQGLSPGSVLIDGNVAESEGYEVGDTITMTFQNDQPQRLRVAGTFLANSLPSQYIVTLQTMERGGLAPRDSLLFIATTPDADIDQVRSDIDAILEDNPTVTLKNPQEFVDEQLAFIDQFLFIIYALLGLAIIIAVLGIINTLALSVIERTREIGLLRAVGLSRGQLRRMIRLESIAIALLGAVLGIAMGLAFGVALQRAIADEGLDILSIPWITLIVVVVLSVIVGVLAAVLPARRAAKLNVLQAISSE